MFEESAYGIHSSVWASMNSWFTPTVLFLLLNLVIGTIVLTSAITNNKKQSPDNEPNHPKINPSVLQRLKSISFYTQNHLVQESQKFSHPELNQTQIFETHSSSVSAQASLETPLVKDPNYSEAHEEKTEESDGFQSIDDVYSQFNSGDHFGRTKSDTELSSGEIPAKLPAKIRKSASLKSPFDHFVEEDIVDIRRPATVRDRENAKISELCDEKVDAKADDFINKFKQQLKLQRLDSILKYKEMVEKSFGGR